MTLLKLTSNNESVKQEGRLGIHPDKETTVFEAGQQEAGGQKV